MFNKDVIKTLYHKIVSIFVNKHISNCLVIPITVEKNLNSHLFNKFTQKPKKHTQK